MTHDPKNVRRWLAILADHYPSLLVSGVARNASERIDALEAELERVREAAYAINSAHRHHAKQLAARADADFKDMLDAKARLAIAVEALEGLYAVFPDCHVDTITCRHGHFAMETPGAGIAAMVARSALATLKEQSK